MIYFILIKKQSDGILYNTQKKVQIQKIELRIIVSLFLVTNNMETTIVMRITFVIKMTLNKNKRCDITVFKNVFI